ncbi:MAG: DNA-protecting protein DprA [Calditrichaeota bacterium]|nr:DNA-protecting protein DprA [Calditrichota bacterium]
MSEKCPALEDVLLLLTIPNIGPGRIRKLLAIFPTAKDILQAPIQTLMRIEGIDQRLALQIKQGGDPRAVQQQLKLMHTHNVKWMTIWDEGYPPLLKHIPDPPVILFYKGAIPNPWPVCLAVVGTRLPSNYGKIITEKLVLELVKNGVAIVSGLARGIDTIAHRTAIRQGGLTFAVLGNGLDAIYPPENRTLFRDIAQHGAVFSEFFLGTGPDAGNFPRRNRIISGMCQGILVIEAGEKSGALITANYAIDHNREVFAVPGEVTNPKSLGCHRLIQKGAKLVHSVEDILEELPLQKAPGVRNPAPPPNLSDSELSLLEQLSYNEPRHIDQLVLKLEESPAVLLSRLLQLELKGLVKQLSGKMFIRT